MKRLTTVLIATSFALNALQGCATKPQKFDEVNVLTWETNKDTDFFPEVDDHRVNVPWLMDRPSFGIAFSGGGTRSASATLGELRALNKLGWIDQARYISANSGGSWTVQPFIYLPKEIQDETFLGYYVPPSKINDSVLQPSAEAENGSMSSAIHRSTLGDKTFSAFKGDEGYANAIGKIFLEPFGLNDRNKVFTFHEKARNTALDVNKDLQPADFYMVEKKRPYSLIVGTLYLPLEVRPEGNCKGELYLLEATPLYTGVRKEFRVPPEEHEAGILIGGGYVSSYGYDSNAPTDTNSKDGLWTVPLKSNNFFKDVFTSNKRYRFTLADVIAMSGAAPEITIAEKCGHEEFFPEFRHWAVNRERVLGDKNLRHEAKELEHGDGGDIDNLAVMPLLIRKVENILVFINTRAPFPRNADCNRISQEDIMVDDLISLFRPVEHHKNNVVIEDRDGEKLQTLCQGFSERKRNGKSLVHCDRYDIRDNDRQTVRGSNYHPSICWVYLDGADDWFSELRDSGGETTSDLKARRGNFVNFPHYRTFGEQKGKLIDLKREQVHALANLAAWTVLVSKDYLAGRLQGATLPTNSAFAD